MVPFGSLDQMLQPAMNETKQKIFFSQDLVYGCLLFLPEWWAHRWKFEMKKERWQKPNFKDVTCKTVKKQFENPPKWCETVRQQVEKGLKQRVKALNLFIEDCYNEQKFMKDSDMEESLI